MILSCKPQFVDPILEKIKIHSMREDKHRRWKPGMKIHMDTEVRTPRQRRFKVDVCVSVQTVDMYRGSMDFMVLVDGRQMGLAQIQEIAKNDGLKSPTKMRDWFIPQAPVYSHDLEEWHGVLIHWTDKKY